MFCDIQNIFRKVDIVMKDMKRLFAILIVISALFCTGAVAAGAVSENYTDVKAKAWYCRAVTYCRENGLMFGVGGNRFDPNGKVTRAMFITVLHRAVGCPEATKKADFTDVPETCYYRDAVDWGVENEIVFGTSAATFSPDDFVTREDIAVFCIRYAEKINAEFLSRPICEEAIMDEEDISAYAKDACVTAVHTTLMLGYNGYFRPKDLCTRAEAAQIIARYCALLAEKPA